jgi:hypothetical protein
VTPTRTQPPTPWSSRSEALGVASARLPGRAAASGHNGRVLKKVIALLVIGFAVYYLLTAPAGAADAVSDAAGGLMDAFQQVGVFFDELVG